MISKNFIYQWIHQMGRCCLHCGSLQANASQFCLECEANLWKSHAHLESFQLPNKKSKALALFKWYPDQDRKVSKLMMAFKEGRLFDAGAYYTENFVSRLYGDCLPNESVLVPCPSLNGRKHSQLLAAQFSNLLNIPVQDVLRKSPFQPTQKESSFTDRFLNELQSQETLDGKYVIFIDDIITTGATALSAQKALGSISGFETWCLAHRCQLAANTTL